MLREFVGIMFIVLGTLILIGGSNISGNRCSRRVYAVLSNIASAAMFLIGMLIVLAGGFILISPIYLA